MNEQTNYQSALTQRFELTAAWRRDVAEEHPDDDRHMDAIRTFDSLALQCDRGDFDRANLAKYVQLGGPEASDDDIALMAEEQGQLDREIGFQEWPTTVDEYLAELFQRFEARMEPAA